MSSATLLSIPQSPPSPLKNQQKKYLVNLIENSKSISQIYQIHAFIYRHNLDQNPVLTFKLQRCYSSLGYIQHSLSVFNQTQNPNLFLFTSLIHSLSVYRLHHHAFLLYSQMVERNITPNEFTISSILKCCPVEPGRLIHGQVLKLGLGSDLYVQTCLVDVYTKGGDLESASKVFNEMPERSLVSLTAMMTCYAKFGMVREARELFDGLEETDLVCWNVMIDGYVQHGLPNEGLVMFQRMLREKLKPNEVTLVAVLSACGQLGAVESGRWIHSYVKSNGIEIDARVGTALIDMYSKCGCLEDAISVFEGITDKDVVVWNSMIVGYAMHGFSQDALRLFNEMCTLGYVPTDITFIGILNACSHAGLVDEGWRFFNLMKDEYTIEPKVEHYGCMVNLLGRGGRLEEAYELVKNMTIERDSILWGTLLGASRLHGNIALGEEIADYLVSQKLAHSGTYILLSNIYAAAGKWDGVARIRTLMKDRGVEKEPGCSSIEVNRKVHELFAGDLRHPKSKEIYMMLEEMNGWLKVHGYIPQKDIVLQDLGDMQKERSLEVHSEKLAIAFGLISTKPGTELKIMKNLRVCSDCHAVTKLISKITGRKIVMRDRNRFHHFVDGSCSCGDFW